MGTLTNGIKEIFATAKSTGSNVMLCGNDGTPDGHITMANLASVLGGLYPKGAVSDDFNNATETGNYACFNSQQANKPPFNSSVLLVIKRDADYITQLALSNDGDFATRVRWAGTWTSWFHIPTFYKNYTVLPDLAVGINNGDNRTNHGNISSQSDLDNFKDAFGYAYSYQTNSPFGREGFILIDKIRTHSQKNIIVQRFISYDGQISGHRIFDWSTNNWGSWYKTETTQI